MNGYGPTEGTTFTTTYVCIKDKLSFVPIGMPISNTYIYVLNHALIPLPIGAIGELYIGGAGLARGYLNRPDLTKERFIVNPFQSESDKAQGKNARLYKTGDLVRYLPDGNIEYIGRNDFQVKIRGFRIELGEIESALSSYIGVKQSVVLAKEHTTSDNQQLSKYLVGYYVADSRLNHDEILAYLAGKLPEYMIPSILVYLDQLPLTINGKLDRHALPDPEFTTGHYVAPRTELESKICAIYAEVLGLAVDKVGVNDDFFRLGGNSILAIRLVGQLTKVLALNISIAMLFRYKTIASLMQNILEQEEIIIPEVVAKDNKYVLSFAQERLWFIEKYEGGSNAYNIPMLFKLGTRVAPGILESSICSIVKRHKILSSLVKTDSDGVGYQLVEDIDKRSISIAHKKLSSMVALNKAIQVQVNYIYQLDEEYPIRVSFYGVGEEVYLCIVVHHIAFDGWSVDIFLKELLAYYNYHCSVQLGKPAIVDLPYLKIQYKDFALWQRSYLSGNRLQSYLDYWKSKLAGYETLNLPLDKQRPAMIDYHGSDVYFKLDYETSVKLRELAKELSVSLYSVLLSGFYLLLRAYSNQNDIVIGTAFANRNYTAITDLIGFFVNSLVLRQEVDANISIESFIKAVGEEVILAQLHQDLPFEKLVEELKVVKDPSRHPIFQVMFSLQNFGGEVNGIHELVEPCSLGSSYEVAKFDLSVFLNDDQDEINGSFNYATSLFNVDTIKRLVNTYTILLEQLAELIKNKKVSLVKIKELSYVGKADYKKLVYAWNETDVVYPEDKTIHELFGEQAKKTPNKIALIYEDVELSYKELHERSNQLANYIRGEYKVKPDDLIALCLDRSEYMLISILAVLKAGGAYVPMDPGIQKNELVIC